MGICTYIRIKFLKFGRAVLSIIIYLCLESKLFIMQQTITIDIINVKAIKLLQDLESLQLIRMRKNQLKKNNHIDWVATYKGAMQKQTLIEIENQLNDLRNSWE